MPKKYNKVTYDGETLIDLTADTVDESSLISGVTAHNAAGEIITGTAVIPSKTSDLTNDGEGNLKPDGETPDKFATENYVETKETALDTKIANALDSAIGYTDEEIERVEEEIANAVIITDTADPTKKYKIIVTNGILGIEEVE